MFWDYKTFYAEAFNCGLTKSGQLSTVYFRVWLIGSEIYIHAGSVSLGKGQKAFKIRPVSQFKTKITHDFIKMNTCRCGTQ